MTQGPPQGIFYALGKTHLAIKSTYKVRNKQLYLINRCPNKTCTYQATAKPRSKHNSLPTRVGNMGNNHPKIPKNTIMSHMIILESM